MTEISADRSLGAVKSEASYGVDIFGAGPPAAYQAFRALTISPIITQIEAPRFTWTASRERSCPLRSHNDVTWEMPLTGKVGAAGTAPAWDAFMLASGFKKTTVAATSVSYKPNTQIDNTDTPSATIWQYLRMLEVNNAYLLKARGYRGNLTMRMTVGDEAVISGTGLALYDPWPTALIASPVAPSSYEGATCMIVQRIAVTVDGVAYPVESMEVSTGWTPFEDRTGEIGKGTLARVLLTSGTSGGGIRGSLKLSDGTTALIPLLTAWQAGAQLAMTAVLTNGTDTITLTAPALQFGSPTPALEGAMKFDVPFYLNRGTTGDDELIVACT